MPPLNSDVRQFQDKDTVWHPEICAGHHLATEGEYGLCHQNLHGRELGGQSQLHHLAFSYCSLDQVDRIIRDNSRSATIVCSQLKKRKSAETNSLCEPVNSRPSRSNSPQTSLALACLLLAAEWGGRAPATTTDELLGLFARSLPCAVSHRRGILENGGFIRAIGLSGTISGPD